MAILTIGVVAAMTGPEWGRWLEVELPGGVLICFCESTRVQ
jgi:hypothetical protein